MFMYIFSSYALTMDVFFLLTRHSLKTTSAFTQQNKPWHNMFDDTINLASKGVSEFQILLLI